MIGKSFLANTLIYSFAGIMNKTLFLLLWIALGWLIAPEVIGQYMLVLFLVEFFSVIAILGLDASLMRFYQAPDAPELLPQFIGLFGISALIMFPLFLLIRPVLIILLPETATVLQDHAILIDGLIISGALANILLIFYTAARQAKKYAFNLFFQSVIFAGLSLFFVLLNYSLSGLLYAKLIASLATPVIFIIQQKPRISFQLIHLAIKPVKKILVYALPIMLQGSLGIISIYYGRILLEKYTSLETFGIYSFFLLLTSQINQLWSFFNQAWTPKIFAHLSTNSSTDNPVKENIVTTTYLFSFLYLLAIAAFIICGQLGLFKIIFADIYQAHLPLLYILLLPPLFSGLNIIAYPLYYYQERTRRIMTISLILIAFNIGLTLFLVRILNETGAAMAVLTLAIISLASYLWAFRKIPNLSPNLIRWSLIMATMAILAAVTIIKTESTMAFVTCLLIGSWLAFKKGQFSKQKHLWLMVQRTFPRINFSRQVK